MKNKVLIAMGIGITAALAPLALGDVEAKADELSPITQQDVNDSEIPATNEGKIDANNDTVEKMQEQQDTNTQNTSIDNEATNAGKIDANNEQIKDAGDAVNQEDVDKLNSLGEKIKEDAAALDGANGELNEAGEKLSEAEEKLTDNDGSNPSEYNALVDDVNSALDDYNGKVADSKEKNQTLKDDSDEYDALLKKVEDDTNKKLDENAVETVKKANEDDLKAASETAETNATNGASNANTVESDKFADTTEWNQDLKNTENKKYSELLSDAENGVTSAKNTLNTAKDGLDVAKGELDSAKERLAAATGSEAYNTALEKYKEAEKAYNTAVDTYNSAKSAYETATGTYKETLAAYADAENKDRLEKGVNKAKANNGDSNTYDTTDNLSTNDGKLIKDITKDSADKNKVSTDDAGKVDAVTDAVDALGSKASALETAGAALTEAEGKLNTAKANLAGADASTITQSEYNALVDAVIGAQTTYMESINNYNAAVTNYNTAASDLVNKYNEYLGAKYKKELADIDTVTELTNATACATNAGTVGDNANIVKGNDDTVEDQSDALGKLKDANWITGQDKKDMDNLTISWNGKLSTLETATKNLSKAATDLENAQTALNEAKASDADYASLVKTYNDAVEAYNKELNSYNGAVGDYNEAAVALVDKYNELRETQQESYDDRILVALNIAKGQVESVSDVSVGDPNTVTNKNDSAVRDFTAAVKAAYAEIGLSEEQVESIFNEIYKGRIDNLNNAKTDVFAAWTELSAKVTNLNEAGAELNKKKADIDDASDDLTEDEFNELKTNYNAAVDEYSKAVTAYENAKTVYNAAIDRYNKAKNEIADFDKNGLVSGENFAKIDADVENINGNDAIMKDNIKKLGIEDEAPSVERVLNVISDENSVTKPYTEATRKELENALTLLMNGLENTVTVDKDTYNISELQTAIKKAAATLSDEDGATDADVDAYNKLVRAYLDFIGDYNEAKETYNDALENYIGERVSQYKETEKDMTPASVANTYNQNTTSGHVDVKADGAVSLELSEDGKWVIKDGGKYDIIGIYATQEEAAKFNGQKGLNFEGSQTVSEPIYNKWGRITGYTDPVTKTVSGTEKLYNYKEEFSFYQEGKSSANDCYDSLVDSNGKEYENLKVSEVSFWVKYKVGDKTETKEFTITSDARFKDNSWFAGEHASELKDVKGIESREVVVGTKDVQKTVYKIDGVEFDNKQTSSSAWKYDSKSRTWTYKNDTSIVVKIDPTKNKNWSESKKPVSEDITKTYYNVSGCNIFEISKYLCDNHSGLDLVLSLEVLEDLRARYELQSLNELEAALNTVTASKTDGQPLSGTITTGLEGLAKAPDVTTIDEISANVQNVEKPGNEASATKLTAGLATITKTARTGDEVKKETDKVAPVLDEIKAPTFGELSKVDVKSVDGSKTFGTLTIMTAVDSGELASATYTPIKLTALEAKGPEGDAFIVDTLFKLALPTVGPDGPIPGPDGPIPGPDGPVPGPIPGPTPVDPVPGDTFIVPMANPVVVPVDPAGPAVLGARRGTGAVLGAKRGLDQAVLGARRAPKTGDSMAVVGLLASLGSSLTGAGVAAGALKKSKKKDAK